MAKWYGLSENPVIANTKATIANDVVRLTFKQIADAFEKEYLNGSE